MFDKISVPGISGSANVAKVPGWIGDPDTIDLYSYLTEPGGSGIAINFNNLNTLVGAGLTWVQFAPDNLGTSGAFLSPGASLITGEFKSEDKVTVTQISGTTSIPVNVSSNFTIGDYIKIGSGTANAEILQIQAIPNSTTLTITSSNYPHNINETVFNCMRQFWIQISIPINETSGLPETFLNIAMNPAYTVILK